MRLLNLACFSLVTMLATPLLWAQMAPAQEGSVCRSLCSHDKTQCLQDKHPVTATGVATLLGLWGAAAVQPQAFIGADGVDAKRDMRDVLDEKQRAASNAKSGVRAWEDKCNQTFMQCLQTCAASHSEAPDAAPKN